MKCPEGLVAILTNPGAECAVRVAFRGAVADAEDVLTATKLPVVSDGELHEVDAKVPAGGTIIVLGRSHAE